tara:strand:+ start:23 stop:349 length:327 start_codon:yes stop_codon:yes gene_type:complete
MKTLHNTKNCNYRRYLHKKLKHGKISGRFYKFLYRNFPYRLTGRNVSFIVREVLDGNVTEDKAIAWLQKDDNELRRQREMAKSNWECRKKISKTTTPYTKPLRGRIYK